MTSATIIKAKLITKESLMSEFTLETKKIHQTNPLKEDRETISK